MLKNPEPRSPVRARTAKPARRIRPASETVSLARIRIAAAIVRHRQEALYDRLADRFRIAFEQGDEKGRDSMQAAAERAREQLTAAGALTPAGGERLRTLLLRDLDRTAAQLLAARLSAAPPLDPALLETGALASLVIVLESADAGILDFADCADEGVAYRTGDIMGAGILTCDKCRTTLRFAGTGTVPPCPTCTTTLFRKSFA